MTREMEAGHIRVSRRYWTEIRSRTRFLPIRPGVLVWDNGNYLTVSLRLLNHVWYFALRIRKAAS